MHTSTEPLNSEILWAERNRWALLGPKCNTMKMITSLRSKLQSGFDYTHKNAEDVLLHVLQFRMCPNSTSCFLQRCVSTLNTSTVHSPDTISICWWVCTKKSSHFHTDWQSDKSEVSDRTDCIFPRPDGQHVLLDKRTYQDNKWMNHVRSLLNQFPGHEHTCESEHSATCLLVA